MRPKRPWLTWEDDFSKTTGLLCLARRPRKNFFVMLKYIITFMLVGGFAASQNANAEPVEIDDLKAQMASLATKLPPAAKKTVSYNCLLYTSPSPRDQRGWGVPA